MDIVFTWNLKKDLETAKLLANENNIEILKSWFGEENYNGLLKSFPKGGHECAEEWVKESFIDRIDHLYYLLQDITNETQDSELVQRRLEAVGFIAQNKE